MTRAEQYFVDQLRAGKLKYVPETGKIWRVAKSGRYTMPVSVLLPGDTKYGYKRLSSQYGQAMQHRVIWEYCVGPIPSEMQINHKDLNKGNNRFTNLEVVTRSENVQHAIRGGRQFGCPGLRHHMAKLTDEQIIEAKRLHTSGEMTLREVAAHYDMSYSGMVSVLNGSRRRAAKEKMKAAGYQIG